jgi:hypothetical protein
MARRVPFGSKKVPGLLIALAAGFAACSANESRSNHSGISPAGDGGAAGMLNGSGGDSGLVLIPTGGGLEAGTKCTDGTGLGCRIDACAGQPKTTVRAKVYDPSGQLPLYDIAVYVPNKPVDPITDGPVCETCGTPVSGDPIASALTNPTGEFVMQDVPVGTGVPLVIQIGKWRREITLPEVKACQENAFDDPTLFRLPKDQTEGHLPKIGMSTGDADNLECLLRRLGISDSEFTNPSGPGRVNIFSDEGSATSYASGAAYPSASPALWGTVDNLRKYDLVLMSCQGSQAQGRVHTTAEKQALKDYVDGGGRAFLEHYHYSWVRGGNEDPAIESARKYLPTPFPAIATWATPADPSIDDGNPSFVDYQIDVSFPKGNDFADWLVNVGASTSKGVISLEDVKNPALDVLPVSQRWIYNVTGSPQAAPYLSANTPIEKPVDQQCGRIVHTGVHVAKVANDNTQSPFPSGCTSAALSAQEKAMAFLLFDLSSCVENVKEPPKPPPVLR